MGDAASVCTDAAGWRRGGSGLPGAPLPQARHGFLSGKGEAFKLAHLWTARDSVYLGCPTGSFTDIKYRPEGDLGPPSIPTPRLGLAWARGGPGHPSSRGSLGWLPRHTASQGVASPSLQMAFCILCWGDAPGLSLLIHSPAHSSLNSIFYVRARAMWRRRRAVWGRLTLSWSLCLERGCLKCRRLPGRTQVAWLSSSQGIVETPLPKEPCRTEEGSAWAPGFSPGGQRAPCRGASHVDFTEKAAMHISLLIYWFLTRSLCWAKKAILHFSRLCWLLPKMTHRGSSCPHPLHQKGGGGGVSLESCSEQGASASSHWPPAVYARVSVFVWRIYGLEGRDWERRRSQIKPWNVLSLLPQGSQSTCHAFWWTPESGEPRLTAWLLSQLCDLGKLTNLSDSWFIIFGVCITLI